MAGTTLTTPRLFLLVKLCRNDLEADYQTNRQDNTTEHTFTKKRTRAEINLEYQGRELELSWKFDIIHLDDASSSGSIIR